MTSAPVRLGRRRAALLTAQLMPPVLHDESDVLAQLLRRKLVVRRLAVLLKSVVELPPFSALLIVFAEIYV
jgi:hypothetical protein